MNDLRSFLRSETHDLHEALDSIIGTFDGIDAYDRFLIGSYRHRIPAEDALGAAEPDQALPRRLAPLLAGDLADRRLAPPATRPLHLSNDIASRLGATYVLEGSALGARILVTSAAALGMNATHGARYLSAQAGAITSWRELLMRLEGVETSAWDRAAGAARSVFAHAIQAFSASELPAA